MDRIDRESSVLKKKEESTAKARASASLRECVEMLGQDNDVARVPSLNSGSRLKVTPKNGERSVEILPNEEWKVD